MSIVASRARQALPRLRREAEALMATSEWEVERLTGEDSLDGYEPIMTFERVYLGPGKLQTYEGHERPATTGPATVVEQRSSIHFPVGSFRSRPGDVATCRKSHDPFLVGRKFRITQAYPVKELATAYRVFVDEVVV